MKVTKLPPAMPRKASPYRNAVHRRVCELRMQGKTVDVVDLLNRKISFINPRGLRVIDELEYPNGYVVITAR